PRRELVVAGRRYERRAIRHRPRDIPPGGVLRARRIDLRLLVQREDLAFFVKRDPAGLAVAQRWWRRIPGRISGLERLGDAPPVGVGRHAVVRGDVLDDAELPLRDLFGISAGGGD